MSNVCKAVKVIQNITGDPNKLRPCTSDPRQLRAGLALTWRHAVSATRVSAQMYPQGGYVGIYSPPCEGAVSLMLLEIATEVFHRVVQPETEALASSCLGRIVRFDIWLIEPQAL